VSSNNNIEHNLTALTHRILRACELADRSSDSVTLIGASKTKPLQDIQIAYALGLRDFGENYLSDALTKINKINPTTYPQLNWHFIGRIQSNKTNLIARHFDWIHTLDRPKIAVRLNHQCPPIKKLNVLIQINIDSDPAKGGLQLHEQDEMDSLLETLATCPNLQLRGLMTILSTDKDSAASYESMAQLHHDIGARLSLTQREHWDTLSMGMSGDLEAAIRAGATHIRIGTVLFGARNRDA